tara:strand:+ start:227 stop:487 length:261 start_codon:yes stop_codon:yes gene_type:complete
MFCATPSGLTWTIRSKPSCFRSLVAKFDHLPELPGGVHVEEGKWRLGRIEGFPGKVQHHGGILADRIQHHRPNKACCHLAEDMNGL